MAVQLRINMKKRTQLDFGQKFLPNHVCGEPEVFTLFLPNLKILNKKQKIFIQVKLPCQSTQLMTQISMFLLQYFWTYGNFHFLPAKRPKMVFQLFLTNVSSMTKSNRYKSTTISTTMQKCSNRVVESSSGTKISPHTKNQHCTFKIADF